MNRKRKNNSVVKSAVIGNLGHILLSFITSILMSFIGNFHSLTFYDEFKNIILFFIFVITLVFWFYIGVTSTGDKRNNIYKIATITTIISILPAAFFTILSNVFSITLNASDRLGAWNVFYVFGGPTLFWHRPFSFISQLMVNSELVTNGYFMYFIDFLLVGFGIFIGSIFFGKSRRRKMVSRETVNKEKEESLSSI